MLRRIPLCAVPLLAALLLALPALLAPAPAAALELGVQDDQIQVADPQRLAWGLAQVRASGVRLTRIDLTWAEIAPRRPANARNPADPAYEWGRFDRAIDAFERDGIRVILNTYRTPDWANGSRGVSVAPNDMNDYAAFIEAMLRRYGERDVVIALEPWNEPNLAWFLSPQWQRTGGRWVPASADTYAAMVRAAARVRDRHAPGVSILGISGAASGPGVPPRGGIGLRSLITALPADLPIDAVSQHIYVPVAPGQAGGFPGYARMGEYVTLLERHFGRPLEVFVTEFGFLTAATPYHSTVVSVTEQVRRLREAVDMLSATNRVRAAIWFNLQDNPNWPSGLFTYPNQWPKPSWRAFGELVRGGRG